MTISRFLITKKRKKMFNTEKSKEYEGIENKALIMPTSRDNLC